MNHPNTPGSVSGATYSSVRGRFWGLASGSSGGRSTSQSSRRLFTPLETVSSGDTTVDEDPVDAGAFAPCVGKGILLDSGDPFLDLRIKHFELRN